MSERQLQENWTRCHRSPQTVARVFFAGRPHEFVQGPEKRVSGLTQNAVEIISPEAPRCADSCNRNTFDGYPETNAIVACISRQDRTALSKVRKMSEPARITDFTIAPGVRETASEDGAVLLDIEQGICFSLNSVGLRIWELLKKGCSVDQIADALGQEFSVPRTELLSDANEFIEALEAKHLIRRPNDTLPKKSWFSRILPSRNKRLSGD